LKNCITFSILQSPDNQLLTFFFFKKSSKIKNSLVISVFLIKFVLPLFISIAIKKKTDNRNTKLWQQLFALPTV